ncbi:MAG: hypothetical protein H6868_08395 [Rhodospirillales bacterium]|nr:hypothetical protein [Rhodospirillales bacterium]
MTLSFFGLFAAFLLAGCTSSIPNGKPVPDLTFAHILPFYVDVSAVDIETRYNHMLDPEDISSGFATPPDIALRRYAEARLQPQGAMNTLKFIIEDASARLNVIEPENKIQSWAGIGRQDRYTVSVRLRLYTETAEGRQGTHSILKFSRDLTVPSSLSLVERETRQVEFLEAMMKAVDKAVVETLRDRMSLAAGMPSYPPGY